MSYSIWRDQLTNVSMSDCSGNQSPASLNCRQQISAFWVVQKYFNSCITFPICFKGSWKYLHQTSLAIVNQTIYLPNFSLGLDMLNHIDRIQILSSIWRISVQMSHFQWHLYTSLSFIKGGFLDFICTTFHSSSFSGSKKRQLLQP